MGRALLVGMLLLAATAAAQQGSRASQRVMRAPQERPEVRPGKNFYFTRAVYSDWRSRRYGDDFRGRRRGSWATDYPEADLHFFIGLTRLTNIDAYDGENALRLDDPAIRRFPLLYAVEVGWMDLTEPEVEGLRGYLLAGGMLFVDDFWGTAEWANFEMQMARVLPEYRATELPPDHLVRRTFYTIDSIVQVPGIWNARRGGPTWERDGYTPHLRGIYDERGRLLVLISYNSDLGDAWEHADDPFYPLPYSNFAFQLGVNAVIYGMSH